MGRNSLRGFLALSCLFAWHITWVEKRFFPRKCLSFDHHKCFTISGETNVFLKSRKFTEMSPCLVLKHNSLKINFC